LFAEATSGLSPPGAAPSQIQFGFHAVSAAPTLQLRSRSYAIAHNPHQPVGASHPRASSVPPPEHHLQQLQLQRTPQQLLAAAITGMPDDDDDDELPDYEQSQHEASQRQRREAARRAAELEARWADSRGRGS